MITRMAAKKKPETMIQASERCEPVIDTIPRMSTNPAARVSPMAIKSSRPAKNMEIQPKSDGTYRPRFPNKVLNLAIVSSRPFLLASMIFPKDAVSLPKSVLGIFAGVL